MEYKVGDKVRITATKHVHGFAIGEEVKITGFPPERDCAYRAENADTWHFVWPDEFEPITKPRICEVLGVEVGEKFRVVDEKIGFNTRELMVDEKGLFTAGGSAVAVNIILCHAINHPETIVKQSCLTPDELTICETVGAKWVSRDKDNSLFVDLWDAEPLKVGTSYDLHDDGHVTQLAKIRAAIFRSVKPGDCICVEEAEAALKEREVKDVRI